MKLEYREFGGMRPAVDERVLERVEATDAVDCDLRYKTVKPFRAPDVATLAGELRTPLGYTTAETPSADINHLHDILHNEGGAIPKGLYEVNERGTCIAASVVATDAHERVYYSVPRGGMYDRGQTDGVGGFEERPVGVARPIAPDDAIREPPQVTGRQSDEMGFTFIWSYFIEDISNGEVDAQGSLDPADIAESVEPDSFNDSVFRYEYTKLVSDGTHPFNTYDPAAYYFIMYGEMRSPEGRFLGTVYSGPSARKGDTDAYVGGTLANASMESSAAPTIGGAYTWMSDIKFSPAGDESSYYRAYLFTYVTDRGEESAPSSTTESISVLPSQKVTLKIDVPNAPDNAVAVRLYRTETTDAGTAFFFVEEIPIPPDPVTYTDIIISVDLPGDTLQTLNWFPPPAGLKGLTLSTKGFYAGYVGSQLFLSEVYIAYAWPTDYAIDFTGDITHIARYGDMLCVFTDREIALIVGNTPLEVRKIKVEGFELLTSIFSTTEMDGILYFATPIGVAAVSGTNVAVVTDDLVSERWWRDNINVQEIRITSFDNALYALAEPDGQVYRIGLQSDGGGLIRLSDENARDLYTSSFYLGVIVLTSLTDGPAYVFDTGADLPRTVIWRGRTEVAGVPMAVISVRCLADDYTTPLIFRVYNETGNVLEVLLTSDKIRKLPVMRRGREWSFEVEGSANIVSLEIGTSGRVR